MPTMKLAYRLPKGSLKKIAEASQTHSSTLGQIISRSQGITRQKAEHLATACKSIGLDITREEWVFAEENDLKFKIFDWFTGKTEAGKQQPQ